MDLLDLAQGYPYLNINIENQALESYPELKDFEHFKNVSFSERRQLLSIKSDEIHVNILDTLKKDEFLKCRELNPYGYFLLAQADDDLKENVLSIKWEDINSIRKYLSEIDEIAFELKLSNLQNEWMQMLHRMMKEAKDYLSSMKKEILSQFKVDELSQNAQEIIKFFEELAPLRLSLFSCVENKDFFKTLNAFLKKWDYVSDFGIDELPDIYRELSGGGLNHYYVPIPREDQFVFLRYSLNPKKGPFKYVVFIVLFNLIDTFLFRDQLKFEVKNESMLIDLVFKNFPMAMALITDKGELLAHNKSFDHLDLLPNHLLKFESGQQTVIAGTDYDIERIKIEDKTQTHNEMNLFVLSSLNSTILGISEQEVNSLSNEQLGIISSSIAHELKNPIAGILAAIDYLKLDDNIGGDTIEDLNSMGASLLRCRDLIEVFLGFSRAETNHRVQLSLPEVLEKATMLLKFRMVESHCVIEAKTLPSETSFNKKINPSVLTMIFYIALSEVMTEFAHFRIISSEKNRSSALKVELFERTDSIELRFPELKASLNRVEQSKLLQHLCDYAGVSFETDTNKIRITEWKLR